MPNAAAYRLAAPIVGAVLTLVPLHIAAAWAAEPVGTWITEDGRARVRTERCGPKNDRLCGYVVWLPSPRDDKGQLLVDKENPDAKKRSRSILGHQMFMGLEPEDDGHFSGKVYSADNGKSYDVHVWSESAAELSVKGCMLKLLCSSQTWNRVSDVLPGQLTGATDAPGGPRADREWAHPAPQPAGVVKAKQP